ncbi:hypothetical protein Syun_029979 [Stephania yunnanensis]|uniref:Uncharacterized protein n=1 Tax=Stephania yunnanensis TaxID=152371 RepID=A0AAP0HLV6_9MAGN
MVLLEQWILWVEKHVFFCSWGVFFFFILDLESLVLFGMKRRYLQGDNSQGVGN